MNRSRIILAFALVTLTACAHREPEVKPAVEISFAQCQRVESPPAIPLQAWTFKEIPAAAQTALAGVAGGPFVALVTADDLRAILSNHSAFKQREDKWQNRAAETNKCLDKFAAPTPQPAAPPTVSEAKPKPKKRFGLF